MHIITAPEKLPVKADLFLAGGISDCPQWQQEFIDIINQNWKFENHRRLTFLNPRRRGQFDKNGIDAEEQITWEYEALRKCQTVLFWFPHEALCPIALFELGVFTQRQDVNLIVGTSPTYQRRFDVIKQLKLARPDVFVYDSISELAFQYMSTVRSMPL